MADDFSSFNHGISGPAPCAIPIAVDTEISATRGVYVGGAGDLNVNMVDGPSLIFYAVAAGTVYPFRVTQALSASTTATSLVALY